MKVVFIGTHFKEGMQALDSRTRSGKLIDRIIELLPGCECYKSNLCPQSRKPTRSERRAAIAVWKPTEGAVHVLLGRNVAVWMSDLNVPDKINLEHPGYALRQGRAKDWPILAAGQIIEFISNLKPAASEVA